MRTTVRIIDIQQITHDVKCFKIEKPAGYRYLPGQATDVSINKNGLENELRPFTFTALQDSPYLEFTIKRYPDHHGITDKLHELIVGDEIIIGDAWGAIEYKGSGYFLAGGAGITPFIAILRSLYQQGNIAGHTLFFSIKTAADIIYEHELMSIMGEQAVFVLTRENNNNYIHGRLNQDFIKQHVPDFTKHFYVCGPDKMISDINSLLQTLGASAEALVFEK